MPKIKKLGGSKPKPKKFTQSSQKTRTKYNSFLKSDYWKMVRASVLARDGRRCQKCGATKRLEVHHKSYAHHGREHLHLGDLVTLCASCHDSVHKKRKSGKS